VHYKMTPGDSRTFKRKRQQAMVLAIGVWAELHEGHARIHVAGNDNFHVIVVDQPDSKRYHPALFRHLRQVLLDNGCWLSAKEAVSIDTQVGTSKESERLTTIRHSDHGRPSVTPSSVDSVKYIGANLPTKAIHSEP
jgi:hypothetical protein